MDNDTKSAVEKFFNFGNRRGGNVIAGRSRILYKSILKRFFKFVNKPYNEVSIEDIDKFYLFLKSKPISACTINTNIACVKGLFRFLKDRNFIKESPVKVKFEKIQSQPGISKQILTREEIQKLFNAIKNPRDQAIFSLMYGNGMRINEIAQLELSDIDLEKRKIIIKGKGGKYRINDLKACVIRRIQVWLILRNELVKDSVKSVFVSRFKKPMSTNGIRHIFNRYVRLSDIKKDITPHSLRHTFICHAIEDGIPLLEIMSIVGHEDIKTTMVYTHILQMNHSYINKFKEF